MLETELYIQADQILALVTTTQQIPIPSCHTNISRGDTYISIFQHYDSFVIDKKAKHS